MATLIDFWDLEMWRRARPDGKRLVVTNGCFDLITAGHLAHLEAGRQLGDILLVGVNDDCGITELKGESRPIIPLVDRLRTLLALSVVDVVSWFPGPSAADFLEIVRPEVYFKGGDYTLDNLAKEERAVLDACKAQIVILPRMGNYSSSDLIKRIQTGSPLGQPEEEPAAAGGPA